MLNQISLGKVASIGMATTLALAFSANNAKALDFTFSGLSSSPLTASGTFRIDDAAIPSSDLSQSDFLDWEINIVNGGNTTTLYGIGGNFGTPNSEIGGFASGISVDDSTLDFSGITSGELFCITTVPSGGCTFTPGQQGFFVANRNFFRFGDSNAIGAESGTTFTATATAVPFELSPTLGLLMVGGSWGVNRLRKSRKSLAK
ncbi:MAG: hypothetical protein QNJ70_15390 [Xenococcaceae cyanobacterium MO_207.B15]|nr:hypothetical protein [Xenococcaceae cyanobacterium MO_207.B15]